MRVSDLAGDRAEQQGLAAFSTVDDGDNEGFAGHLDVRQSVLRTEDTLNLDVFAKLDYVNRDFRNIERLYRVEFNRDWNLEMPMGDQRLLTAGVAFGKRDFGNVVYEFQNLDFSENFQGIRHVLSANNQIDSLKVFINASYLDSKSDVRESNFGRVNSGAVYGFGKAWVGGKFNWEDNQVKTIAKL